ncbi:MAG: PD-(D/E)XK nuclease family protein [Deltaproteobacteria bacterium]|nr:PD-(D/E)XK nuclease family protein [Deltaproteobacteria bacterium]
MVDLPIPPATSASQLVQYAMCPRKYAFAYIYGFEPAFRSPALILGSATHSAIAWWFTERIDGRTPTLDQADAVLAADLLAGSAGTDVRWKDATPESLETDGRRLLRLYLSQYGDLPVVAIEAPFEVDLFDDETGECFGRPLKGYFDLTLDDHRVVEIKTSARGWSESDLVRHLQVGAYCHAWNTLHGGPSQIEVHVIVKLKREPRVEVFPVSRGESASRWWLHAAGAIERAIAGGHYPPAPGPLCGACEYESACAAWVDEEPVQPARRRLPIAHVEQALAATL